MRIGIIGAGKVGTTLGAGWARAGHEVVLLRAESAVPAVPPRVPPEGTPTR